MTLDGRSHVRLTDLQFVNYGLAPGGTALHLRNCRDIVIDHCRFGPNDIGLMLDGNSSRVTVQHCEFLDAMDKWYAWKIKASYDNDLPHSQIFPYYSRMLERGGLPEGPDDAGRLLHGTEPLAADVPHQEAGVAAGVVAVVEVSADHGVRGGRAVAHGDVDASGVGGQDRQDGPLRDLREQAHVLELVLAPDPDVGHDGSCRGEGGDRDEAHEVLGQGRAVAPPVRRDRSQERGEQDQTHLGDSKPQRHVGQ